MCRSRPPAVTNKPTDTTTLLVIAQTQVMTTATGSLRAQIQSSSPDQKADHRVTAAFPAGAVYEWPGRRGPPEGQVLVLNLRLGGVSLLRLERPGLTVGD